MAAQSFSIVATLNKNIGTHVCLQTGARRLRLASMKSTLLMTSSWRPRSDMFTNPGLDQKGVGAHSRCVASALRYASRRFRVVAFPITVYLDDIRY
jgi:hypothetical protein